MLRMLAGRVGSSLPPCPPGHIYLFLATSAKRSSQTFHNIVSDRDFIDAVDTDRGVGGSDRFSSRAAERATKTPPVRR